MGEADTRHRWSPVAEAIGGRPSAGRDEGSKLTLVPGVESFNRGSGLPLAYASGLSPPSSARRESAVRDVSHSTTLTTCADSHTRCVETHTTVTDFTSTKQSAHASFVTAKADIDQSKDRHTDLKVDSAEQSTYLQRTVTSLSPLTTAQTQVAPHRVPYRGPQTLFIATAQVVASPSPTPSKRSTFSVQAPQAHRTLPHRSAFSATAFLTGREVNDAEAKMQSNLTTTVGTMVSHIRKSVSKGKYSARETSRDTPSSTLSSTDNEVGARVP